MTLRWNNNWIPQYISSKCTTSDHRTFVTFAVKSYSVSYVKVSNAKASEVF
ncbi:hypothetical protein X801_09976 [Opisthorchis viverrini]|uniref:Uncharacterized protein n=1 Tax=Opisthorchis viverrini TaxID=6198 RepID=A0A1S8WID7_OPIVI|nr:hypothetical protein X801_09976 [Opisthorchis viverrini]